MKRGIAGLIGLVVCGACSQAPSDESCQKLLEHVVEIELKPAATGGDVAAKKQRVIDQVGKDFVATCSKDLRAAQVDCALRAKSGEQLASCDET